MKRLFALATTGALLVSCTADGAADTTTTITTAPERSTTSSQATTTSMDSTTSTSAAPSTTSTTSSDPLAPEGSGCTHGTESLPDGRWYGGIREFGEEGIGFDLACFFVGDAAAAASAEDGEESPPPNDYYVRNENEQVRELAIAPETPVTWFPTGDPNDAVDGSFQEWTAHLATLESYLAIWVTIEDGTVTMIEEQWVP